MKNVLNRTILGVTISLRGGAKLTPLILLVFLLLISSCSGTGGVADSDGETYGSSTATGGSAGAGSGSGGSTAGGITGSSGGELTAWEIMQKMDGGHGDEVVAILSGGSTDPVVEERGTFEVVLPASSMNLPDGGWVQLEIEEGDMHYKETAFAGPDGNVYFTAPRLRIGAFITVTLTAFTPDGNPYRAGSKNSYVEEGGATAFNVSLTDLNNPTVTYTDAMLTDEAAEGGYRIVRYSWLHDESPKFSVTNPYDDGSATMTVKFDGDPLTGDAATGNISNYPLTDGQHTINITLSNPAWRSDITVEKKIKVKMKAVKVQCGEFRGWYTNLDSTWPGIIQQVYIKGINSSSAGEYPGENGSQKTALNITKTHPNQGDGKRHHVATDPASNYVYLTDPDSKFRFWTSQCEDDNVWNGTYGPGWLGKVSETYSGAAQKLSDLRSLLAPSGYSGQVFDIGDFDENGNYTTDSSKKRSHYQLDLSLSDAAYTEGTDN